MCNETNLVNCIKLKCNEDFTILDGKIIFEENEGFYLFKYENKIFIHQPKYSCADWYPNNEYNNCEVIKSDINVFKGLITDGKIEIKYAMLETSIDYYGYNSIQIINGLVSNRKFYGLTTEHDINEESRVLPLDTKLLEDILFNGISKIHGNVCRHVYRKDAINLNKYSF